MRTESHATDTPSPTATLTASLLALYVVVSLTIPFWVPIVKRLTGDCGVFWVCSLSPFGSLFVTSTLGCLCGAAGILGVDVLRLPRVDHIRAVAVRFALSLPLGRCCVAVCGCAACGAVPSPRCKESLDLAHARGERRGSAVASHMRKSRMCIISMQCMRRCADSRSMQQWKHVVAYSNQSQHDTQCSDGHLRAT